MILVSEGICLRGPYIEEQKLAGCQWASPVERVPVPVIEKVIVMVMFPIMLDRDQCGGALIVRSFAVIIQDPLIVWGPLIARSSAAQKIDQIRLGGPSPRTLFCWRGGQCPTRISTQHYGSSCHVLFHSFLPY